MAAAAGADSGSISPSFVLGRVLYNKPPGRQGVVKLRGFEMFSSQRHLCRGLSLFADAPSGLASLIGLLSIDISIYGFEWSKDTMPILIMLCKLYHLAGLNTVQNHLLEQYSCFTANIISRGRV